MPITQGGIVSNAERYTSFLTTAANNYKYSFQEQLLIHAQKPDATACAEIEVWNKLGRWVNKGTKGIALLVDRDVPYRLRYAEAEGVTNTSFQKGDACKLDFADETFDAVTSNYVYHNITGKNKQSLLRETLRVLKKGGIFAIHDLMEPSRYGDMEQFVCELKAEGYEDVQLIHQTSLDCSHLAT